MGAIIPCETLYTKKAFDSIVAPDTLMVLQIDGEYLKNPRDKISDKLLKVLIREAVLEDQPICVAMIHLSFHPVEQIFGFKQTTHAEISPKF